MSIANQIHLRATKQSFLFRTFMTPLARVYQIVIWLRNKLFDLGIKRTHSLRQPVISVGNLAAGGTGKSPIVGYLARILLDHGQRPVILSRGYGSGLPRGNTAIFLDGDQIALATPGPSLKPDEPRMLSARLNGVPIVLCADRYQGTQFLIKTLPDYKLTHWILDDGFQHRYLNRDVDIVLLDARAPFGNGFLLPRGSLREPASSLRRANVIIFTRVIEGLPTEQNIRKARSYLAEKDNCFFAEFVQEAPRLVLGSPKILEQGVNLVCAIAQPGRLYKELQEGGYTITNLLVKSDHSSITLQDINLHCNLSLPIITTEKDYWRDQETFEKVGLSTYVIPMKVEFRVDDCHRLLELLKL